MEINLNESKQVVQQAIAKAIQLQVNANIAVLDTAGHLKVFERMDDAFLGSMDIAIKKAKTACLFRTSSANVGEYLKPEARAYGMTATNDGLVGFAGGLPIFKNNEIIGYIGVSGGAVPEDLEIATAGAGIFDQK
ncbi:heme-binding protein [Sphingobacterium sp. N143]|uniref:GlcG/HbpS family heme-binding protein n=1 Tax=Sphingobacterium sp. N143 TaxID=2746727 RepID=UPI002575D1C4|nr:heme-binding protein [Sphingobacterium sp. N143]MDM1293954.1 heme-binding protein [Sphingobacterium sp. N143]